jgi:hypothetical protein
VRDLPVRIREGFKGAVKAVHDCGKRTANALPYPFDHALFAILFPVYGVALLQVISYAGFGIGLIVTAFIAAKHVPGPPQVAVAAFIAWHLACGSAVAFATGATQGNAHIVRRVIVGYVCAAVLAFLGWMLSPIV